MGQCARGSSQLLLFCPFYGVPEHGSCHRMSPQVKSLRAITLSCSGTRQNEHVYMLVTGRYKLRVGIEDGSDKVLLAMFTGIVVVGLVY
jgi:hypothetical protein